MKKLLLLLALVSACAIARADSLLNFEVSFDIVKGGTFKSTKKHQSGKPSGCGKGTANDQCGKYSGSDAYEGASAPTPTDTVSACGTLSGNNKVFALSGNVGSDATAVCLILTGVNSKLDLKGFTLTGLVQNSNVSTFDGWEVMNGKISCNKVYNHLDIIHTIACFYVQQPGGGCAINNQIRFHHLVLENLADATGTEGKRNFYVDWGGGCGGSAAFPHIRLDHITSSVSLGSGSSRTYNIGFVSDQSVKMDHNDITCASDSGPCQVLLCYGTGSSKCEMSDNLLVNGVFGSSTDDTPRAVMADAGANNLEAMRNTIYARDGRAARVRDSYGFKFHDNEILDIRNQTGATNMATIHLADPDSGTFDLSNGGANPCEVYNNDFYVNDSAVRIVGGRAGSNCKTHDNTVYPQGNSGGYLGYLRSAGAGGLTLTFKDNALGGWTGTSGVNVYTETGTTAHVCNSGVAGGVGTTDSTCP